MYILFWNRLCNISFVSLWFWYFALDNSYLNVLSYWIVVWIHFGWLECLLYVLFVFLLFPTGPVFLYKHAFLSLFLSDISTPKLLLLNPNSRVAALACLIDSLTPSLFALLSEICNNYCTILMPGMSVHCNTWFDCSSIIYLRLLNDSSLIKAVIVISIIKCPEHSYTYSMRQIL